jgi:hypothetical protein
LSIASIRLRPRLTSAVTLRRRWHLLAAVADAGEHPLDELAPGNACSMKKSWMRRSSAPRSSTTSARSTPRPARPTCW